MRIFWRQTGRKQDLCFLFVRERKREREKERKREREKERKREREKERKREREKERKRERIASSPYVTTTPWY